LLRLRNERRWNTAAHLLRETGGRLTTNSDLV
jgi:hypothetical protein